MHKHPRAPGGSPKEAEDDKSSAFFIILPHTGSNPACPLFKAVYLLFLRHPEGIIFKHLPDYREELAELYSKIRGEKLDNKMLQSVMDVTDPFKNSINEKVARIREAFIANIDERIAREYIVVGGRGATKSIAIPRDLVRWE